MEQVNNSFYKKEVAGHVKCTVISDYVIIILIKYTLLVVKDR